MTEDPCTFVVQKMIAQLPRESQNRINIVADILRQLLVSESRDEIELAFTLVMSELADG